MIAAFYFPCGIIIRTNIEGSKANVDIVLHKTRKKRERDMWGAPKKYSVASKNLVSSKCKCFFAGDDDAW